MILLGLGANLPSAAGPPLETLEAALAALDRAGPGLRPALVRQRRRRDRNQAQPVLSPSPVAENRGSIRPPAGHSRCGPDARPRHSRLSRAGRERTGSRP